ncbi:RAMP superfamily CRISPR-associated protein [Acanthopleuribacter pedis]|uniref:CRISPR type III-associated protein domain-containing protein n=1 Tax=Acanthopleuribacter pedis TaxID=442870 RepID=A0A8J7U5D3_9BACT|nr:RAMP superfamily CRISPR-associated protein [Acanthopleuribacter pedis]MBO1320323.1 hypothetical protein [Acanthopleuribacter pedis]
MSRYSLHVVIESYWQIGSGRGGGLAIDSVVHKDADGLPELPGRGLRGLVRDAAQRAEDWGHLPNNWTANWFGTDTRHYPKEPNEETRDDDPNRIDRHHSQAGWLIFDNAVLPGALRNWLRVDETGLRDQFYRNLYATALHPERGTALPGSLRGMEVVVPLNLVAPLTLKPEARGTGEDFAEKLGLCLPLIRGLGIGRTRGLGRCRVTLEEKP